MLNSIKLFSVGARKAALATALIEYPLNFTVKEPLLLLIPLALWQSRHHAVTFYNQWCENPLTVTSGMVAGAFFIEAAFQFLSQWKNDASPLVLVGALGCIFLVTNALEIGLDCLQDLNRNQDRNAAAATPRR